MRIEALPEIRFIAAVDGDAGAVDGDAGAGAVGASRAAECS